VPLAKTSNTTMRHARPCSPDGLCSVAGVNWLSPDRFIDWY
jgi:hypothetical protein